MVGLNEPALKGGFIHRRGAEDAEKDEFEVIYWLLSFFANLCFSLHPRRLCAEAFEFN